MPLRRRRILLTGGAGFIGSHLAEALLDRGAKLTILDNLDSFYPPARKTANLDAIRRRGPFDFANHDIGDFHRCREVFMRARPEIVIHLAARAGVRPSIDDPTLYARVNVTGTVNMLELAREFGAGRFVFGSSSSVYGEDGRPPFSEMQTDLHPVSPYAATKLAGETFCATYARLAKLPAVCLRFFTVYGPRQRPDLAIHKFTALIESGKPVPVFGDGTTGRDYTHVSDIVDGILAAIDCRLVPAAPFEIFNLGNSQPVTLSNLVELLERATGRKAIRATLPPQPGDVPLTWADIGKARRILGYHPATPFEAGLQEFVAWYRASGAGGRDQSMTVSAV